MIIVPLGILITVFAACIVAFFALGLINLYHITMTGSTTPISIVMSIAVFVLGSIVIMVATNLMFDIDWSREITVFNPGWFTQGGATPTEY